MPRALAAALLAAAACGGVEEPLTEATLSLTQVPTGVACVLVEADGPARSVARSVDVGAGAASTFTLSGLPVGAVVFTAHAYASSCGALTGGASWTWFAAPATAMLTAGSVAQVALTLYR